MLKKIALVIVGLIVVVLIVAATKPSTIDVRRSASINAPAEKIFPLINDFHNFSRWSPYEKLDPGMKRAISGAPTGKGAVYEWDGNSQVGAGRMEIVESTPSSRVLIKLDFLKPLEGHDMADFTLEPEGSSTKVTWAMRGPATYISKIIDVFISMDRMIGGDFQTGLANLKALAEK